MTIDAVLTIICACVATAAILTAAGIWMDKKIWAQLDLPREPK